MVKVIKYLTIKSAYALLISVVLFIGYVKLYINLKKKKCQESSPKLFNQTRIVYCGFGLANTYTGGTTPPVCCASFTLILRVRLICTRGLITVCIGAGLLFFELAYTLHCFPCIFWLSFRLPFRYPRVSWLHSAIITKWYCYPYIISILIIIIILTYIPYIYLQYY